jgi:hypothetical protein
MTEKQEVKTEEPVGMDRVAQIKERLELAGIKMSPADFEKHLAMADDLGEFTPEMEIPAGYKKCGRCQHVMKYYLFNKNSGAKSNTTGNCKACQKQAAAKSYQKTKNRRNYKEYYANNKERKQQHAREYYDQHKEEILAKQKDYHSSAAGKKVMHKSHKKRRKSLKANQGIPYTREMVIDRDKMGGKIPMCYICREPIKDMTKLHLDHVIPVLIGGLDCFTNIGCTHDTCNLTKKKDGTDVTADQIQYVRNLAENYIDTHPELFADQFEDVEGEEK